MPKKVEECVDSILEENPEMNESTAWAICQDQFNESKLLKLRKELDLSEKEAVRAMELVLRSETDEMAEKDG